MAFQVCTGAVMMCSFGAAPSTLAVLPANCVLTTTPAANIMDNKPIVNVPPFGMCSSLANPTVAAATAAALGVLTPMPCVPVTAAPWVVGALAKYILPQSNTQLVLPVIRFTGMSVDIRWKIERRRKV